MALGFVRPARPAEAGEIARIQLTTWRIAYRRMLPRQVLDALDEGFLAARWADAIETPPSERHRVLVAVEQSDGGGAAAAGGGDGDAGAPTAAGGDAGAPATAGGDAGAPATAGGDAGSLVGFVAAGPADGHALAPDEPPLGEHVVAVTDLIVEPRWGRRGHGSRLLAASVDLWRADGFRTAVAWAYEQDAATRRFLGSAGWEPDGAVRGLDVDDLVVNQLRLHVAL